MMKRCGMNTLTSAHCAYCAVGIAEHMVPGVIHCSHSLFPLREGPDPISISREDNIMISSYQILMCEK